MTSDDSAGGTFSARAMFEADTASRALGIVLRNCSPGRASVSMTVAPTMVNGHTIAHGGFIFTLADTAFALACNGHGAPTVATGGDITFIGPARLGEELTADAVERVRYGRNGICDVTVRCEDRVVAEFRGTSRALRRSAGPAAAEAVEGDRHDGVGQGGTVETGAGSVPLDE